ncbi:MAG: alcohol dehydrogenase catalytic domain-containing protein, partial [Anaerolineales bacterium]
MSSTRPMAFVTKAGAIDFRERPIPELGAHDVRISVQAVTLCGSDLHIFKGKHPAAPLPVPVGHEIAGRVERIGAEVSQVQPGDRVAVEPVIACGECRFCQRGQYHLCLAISFQYRQGQGGLTPTFIAPERWVHPLPNGISYAEGALLEPLSVAVHAVEKAALGLGDSVAIFGDGAIGLLLLQVAKATGAGSIFLVGINPHRLELASRLGADVTLNNLENDPIAVILERTGRLGVARSFEAVGLEETLIQSLEALQKGGQAVLLGLFEQPTTRLPANIFVQKEITLTGSQGYNWDFQTAIKLVEQDRVDLKSLI